jgi:hypothetical protein
MVKMFANSHGFPPLPGLILIPMRGMKLPINHGVMWLEKYGIKINVQVTNAINFLYRYFLGAVSMLRFLIVVYVFFLVLTSRS